MTLPRKKTSRGAELVASLRRGATEELVVPWPGTDQLVVLRPLSDEQLQLCDVRAQKRCASIELTLLGSSEAYTTETHTQALALALHDVDTGERLFEDADEVRSLMRPPERFALITSFLALQNRTNPRELTEDQYAQIAEYVKKKDVIRLSGFDSAMLASFLVGTASQPSS